MSFIIPGAPLEPIWVSKTSGMPTPSKTSTAASSSTAAAEEEAPHAVVVPDPTAVKYHPLELPANAFARAAFPDHLVDDSVPLGPLTAEDRKAAGEAAVAAEKDKVQAQKDALDEALSAGEAKAAAGKAAAEAASAATEVSSSSSSTTTTATS